MISATVWVKDLLSKINKSPLRKVTKYFSPPPNKIASDIATAIPIMGSVVSLACLIASIFLCIGVMKGNFNN